MREMSGLRSLLLVVLVAGSVLAAPASAAPGLSIPDTGAGAADAVVTDDPNGTTTASTGATDPSVNVTVDSLSVNDGDRLEKGREVGITVDAAVGTAAANGTELAEVVVRVNGERARSFDVNGTTATESVRPSFDQGDNEVRVLVTDTAGAVNATRFTVFLDREAPHVYLTEPYRTDPYVAIHDGVVDGTAVTIAGGVADQSDVERVQVTHRYGPAHQNVTVFRDVEDNFSVDLTLGLTRNGSHANEFRVAAVDEFDNVRVYHFEINVTDAGPPVVDVDPYPNETRGNQFYFAGTVSDDVYIREASVTFRPVAVSAPEANETDHESIVEERSYELDPDGRTATFNESFHPAHVGTYEMVVNATDVTGANVSRRYRIERLPYEPTDYRPTVAVDRERTVVLDDETLFVSGSAYDGVTRRLVVETRRRGSDDTVDYQVVHDGGDRDRIAFDREVAIGPGDTVVLVRATDPDGNEVTERFVVNGTARETFVTEADEREGTDPDPWPLVTVTPLDDGRPATASSSVTVRRAVGNDTVAVPPVEGRQRVAGTANVSLDALDVDVAAPLNLTATVVVSERGDGPLQGPPGASVAGTVQVQHSTIAGAVNGVSLAVSVAPAYLDRHGLDPGNLTVYRLSDGNWTDLDAELVAANGSTVRYRVASPGLSVFALAPRGAVAPTDTGDAPLTDADFPDGDGEGIGDGGVLNGPADGLRVGNGTIETFVANATEPGNASGDTATGPGGATGASTAIQVTNVTLNRTAVGVNESFRVTAHLRNTGNSSGTFVTGLQTLEGFNRTFVTTREVSVPAGGERTVEYTHRFAERGNYTVSVNGTEAGPVVVSGGGGGLLSVFAFLPLRLLGMVLGAVVGLVVVLVLVRFVLGRVGGGDEEASG